MKPIQVWYMRPEWFAAGVMGREPNAEDLAATHVHLKTLQFDDTAEWLNRVFQEMQGEVWSPKGEARALIREKGLAHTSMSVGDVLLDESTGAVYLVAAFGFKVLRQARGGVTWHRVGADRYEYMLGVLPPELMTGYGFLVGEAADHRTCTVSGKVAARYAAFVKRGPDYFESARPLTRQEFAGVKPGEVTASPGQREGRDHD